MEQITYENVSDKLIQVFPGYAKSSKYFDPEERAPYLVLGNLSLMAFTDIDNQTDTTVAEKLVKLTDDVLNSPASDEKLINLFAIEVFEKLVGYKTGARLAKSLLHGKSIEILNQTLKHYNTDAFLEEYRK